MAKHPELTGDFLHVPGYVQPTDPGAVGGGKLWIDTSAGSGNWQTKIRNVANTAWEAVSGGGAGATQFTGLTDTPAAYAGAANYKLVVNGTETGVIFVPDSGGGVTVFTGLTDVPASYAGSALFAVRVNAGETGLEFVDFGGVFLPLTGGIMTGNIDFADLAEGIRFDDGAGAKFNGLKFEIVTDPEIVIGEEAPDIGGHPFVRANTGILRIGEGAGAGFGFIEMWNDDAGAWTPIVQFTGTAPGDPLIFGTGDNAIDLNGSETRPTYNGADLALLSDAGGPETGLIIPHNAKGDGNAIKVVANQANASASFGGGETMLISAATFVRALEHGAVSPPIDPPEFNMSRDLGSTWIGWNNNPWSIFSLFDMAVDGPGVFIVLIAVRDGVNVNVEQVAFVFDDSDGLPFPP